MFGSLRSLRQSTLCSAFLVGIYCYGEPLGFVSSVYDFWMFQYAHPKCWKNCLIYLPGMHCLSYCRSEYVSFQINGWDSLVNVITKGWGEEKENTREGFPISMHILLRYPSQCWWGKWKINPERTYVREGMKCLT